jgi:uncharacterized protein
MRRARLATRWAALLTGMLLVAAGAGGGSTAAQPLGGEYYQATVIVTGTDTRSRPTGFAQALRAVLVTVSGEPRLHDDPRVDVLAARADGLVASYSYVDRMAGRPVHDEQGTRDRPYNLTVHFDPAKVDAALATLREHPWRGPRPAVLPVVTVEGFGRSYLLTAESSAGTEQRAAFADVARDFGMTVRFPSDAELAAWDVAVGRFPSPRVASSPEQAVVAGTLQFQEALPGWIGSWKLRWRGAAYAWGIRGVNYDQAFRDLVRGVVRVASGHGAPD